MNIRTALCIFFLAVLSMPAYAKAALDFSGTYSARIKANDGSVGIRVIHIAQTSDSVHIETVGAKAQSTWYKLGDSILITDARGVEHRARASISGRVLRIAVEHQSPPDAVSGTDQTTYTLSKDRKHLSCTHGFLVADTSNLSGVLTDDYTRVEEPPANLPAK